MAYYFKANCNVNIEDNCLILFKTVWIFTSAWMGQKGKPLGCRQSISYMTNNQQNIPIAKILLGLQNIKFVVYLTVNQLFNGTNINQMYFCFSVEINISGWPGNPSEMLVILNIVSLIVVKSENIFWLPGANRQVIIPALGDYNTYIYKWFISLK